MTKNTKYFILCGFFVLSGLISTTLIYHWMLENFDYCVMHICSCTHAFGVQDVLYLLLPFNMIIFCFVGIHFLDKATNDYEGE